VPEKILVVDDEKEICKLCQRVLTESGYSVLTAGDYNEAIKILKKERLDLVLTDLRLDGHSGLDILSNIKERYPLTSVIIMRAYASVESAIEALRKGCYDYLLKPVDIDEVVFTVKRCIQHQRAEQEVTLFKETSYIYQFAQEISKTGDEETLLRLILKSALLISKADSGSILVYDDSTETLELKVSIGLDENITKIMKVGERIAGYVVKRKEALILENGLKKYPEFSHVPSRDDITCSICMPVMLQDKVIGVLCLNKQNVKYYIFSEHEEKILNVFCSHASLVIQAFRVNKELNELDKLKNQFIANVSHELRTPLMSISGAVELLESSMPDGSKQLIELISRNTQRMTKLVGELLDFSKLETGVFKYCFMEESLQKLLNDIVKDFEKPFHDKNIELTASIPGTLPPVKIDKSRINQAISNLMSNALKFTEPNSRVKLTAKKSKGEIVISVEDTGIGIDKEHLGRIFDRFYQVDGSITRERSGVGIGLAISKKIIEDHKGRIWAESESNKGSKFYITLPI